MHYSVPEGLFIALSPEEYAVPGKFRETEKLRKIVSELMIYDRNSILCSSEASDFEEANEGGAWTVETVGVEGVYDIGGVLNKYMDIEQLDFCTHGDPGEASFSSGEDLTVETLQKVTVPFRLFKGPGRLLFMGCDTARGEAGLDFLIAAGRRFFAGKGGIVGGATVATEMSPGGTRLPLIPVSITRFGIGKLLLVRLDAQGNVIDSKGVLPLLRR
jgi:hypothetical protein